MISPQVNQVPSRMMLAMGEYGGLQSYTEFNIVNNRDLPPNGAEAMRDVLWVMNHPEGPLIERYLRKYESTTWCCSRSYRTGRSFRTGPSSTTRACPTRPS